MTKQYRNIDLDIMRKQVKALLTHKDIIGYAAARNYRILSNALTEYDNFKNSLIEKYGTQDVDNNGDKLSTFSIKIGTSEYESFCKDLNPINSAQQEVDIMTINYKDTINVLSGDEILSIDWMLDD